MWIESAGGEPLYVNQRWRTYTGFMGVLPSNATLLQFIHLEDVEQFISCRKTRQNNHPFTLELRIKGADDLYRRHLLTSRPMYDESEENGDWNVVCTDIDEMYNASKNLKFLSTASEVLAGSLDLKTTLRRITELVVSHMADACSLEVLQRERLTTVALASSDPHQYELWVRLASYRTSYAVMLALKTGKVVCFPILTPEILRKLAMNEEHAKLFIDFGLTSGMVVPLLSRESILGVMRLGMQHGRYSYTSEDVHVAEDLARRAALAIENAQLFEHERLVAQSFQNASLPAAFPTSPGLCFSGFYEPGSSEALIGGDWYDAFRLPDGRILLSMGDVAGCGLQAAIIMSTVRHIIRGVAHISSSPSAILEAADKALRSEHPDHVVTAFVGIIDIVERTLVYASAGHPPPMLRRYDGSVEELGGSGLPLGLRLQEGQVNTIFLREGEMLVLYTDGLIESTHDILAGLDKLRLTLAEEAFLPGEGEAARYIAGRLLGDHASDDVAILTVAVPKVSDNERLWRYEAFDAGDARQARKALEEYLAYLRTHGEEGNYEAAVLVFLELLGNVVRYAPGMLEMAVDWSGPAPVLHILDRGAGFNRSRWDMPADLLSESGRGLSLIDCFTEDFQIMRRQGGGSHARAVLSLRRSSSCAFPST